MSDTAVSSDPSPATTTLAEKPARPKRVKKIKYVYSFGDGKAEGKSAMKDLLGGKGANVAEMTNLGIPVPPGFTITTQVCDLYYKQGKRWPAGLEEQGLE